MRTIEWTGAFKRDYRREKKGQHGRRVHELLDTVVTLLANNMPLPESYRDHPLSGEWKGYRDCHVRPDLVLIYTKPGPGALELTRLGSHAELFG